MLYVLPADPASPKSSLKTLRQTARRAGYLIAADYTTDTFTLVDARLRLPLLGLNHVGLPEIANAIEVARIKTREARPKPKTRRRHYAIENLKLLMAAVRAE